MKLSAGKYDQPVIILERQETRGATGAIDRTEPTEVCRRWANVIPQTSTRFQILNAAWVEMEAAYTLNGPTPVREGHWLEHLGIRYQIVGIETPGNVPPASAGDVTVICKGLNA